VKKTISFILALVMLLSVASAAAFASETVSYEAVYGICDGKGFYCDSGYYFRMNITDMSTAEITFNGYTEKTSLTSANASFAFTFRYNLFTGLKQDDCLIVSGFIDGRSYTFMLVKADIYNGSSAVPASSSTTTADPVAEARAQGVTVPADMVINSTSGEYVSFYSTDRDNGVWCKSKPENSTASRVTAINFPFNGYLYGTYNGWHLIKADNGSYYYIPASIVGYAKVTVDPAYARRGEGLVSRIEAQGVTVPADFQFSDVKVGEIRNETGSSYYALYKFKDPYHDTKEYSYDLLYYYCQADSRYWNVEAKVTVYGYYNGRALYETKAGEFFWAKTSEFFKAY